jgi:hypothetical protein
MAAPSTRTGRRRTRTSWSSSPLADAAKYRNNKAKWTADSPEVKAVAKWSGAKPEDARRHGALPLSDCAGPGDHGWAAARTARRPAPAATAELQLSQKQIEKTLRPFGCSQPNLRRGSRSNVPALNLASAAHAGFGCLHHAGAIRGCHFAGASRSV